MWQKFREFITLLAPPYDGPSYFDRHAEIEAARMRLRDEFAMAALPVAAKAEGRLLSDDIARMAYELADAMMLAREDGEKE